MLGIISDSLVPLPFLDLQTNLKFPLKLGGLHIGKFTEYGKQQPGLGVGVGYNYYGITATAYIYNRNIQDIGSGVDFGYVGQEVMSALHEIKMLEHQGVYSVIGISEIGAFEFGSDESTFNFKGACAGFVSDGARRTAWIMVTAYKSHFLKIRHTVDRTIYTEDEIALNSLLIFMEDFCKILV